MDPELLTQALAHRSWCSEAGGMPSNERLELLGDAVLGLVVTDHLYRTFPLLPEGDLARLKAGVVSTEALAPAAASIGVGEEVLLGRGEEASGGRSKASILADCLEAIIGAVYLSSGLDASAQLVVDLLGAQIAGLAADGRLGDAKNQLQELAARLGLEAPAYLVSDRGPEHAKLFTAVVSIGADELGIGTGPSKKHAERHAARLALDTLAARYPPA